jgi:plastocyanin
MKAIASLATVMPLLAGVGLVACGDDDEDSAATEATTTEEAAAGGGGATEIGMTEYAFDPADATVSRGDTITVTNGGELAHNYTVMAGDQSVDEALPPGERHLARQLATTGDVDLSGCPTPPPNPPQPQPPPPEQPPAGPPGTPPPELTLDLGAKKQKMKKKVKFSATASADATLVAEGKKIKETTTQLAANQETTVKAKLKRKALNRLEDKGKGKVKIEGTASALGGGTATDAVKVKLED